MIAAPEEPVRTIVLLGAMTGLRIGEILALRWGRIDSTAAALRVAETCYHGHFGTPKMQIQSARTSVTTCCRLGIASAPFAVE